MTHITILSASVGAGHDGAAAELARRLREQGFTVGCHDFLDVVPAAMGRSLRKAYELQLKVAPDSYDWLLGALNSGPLAASIFVQPQLPLTCSSMAVSDPPLTIQASPRTVLPAAARPRSSAAGSKRSCPSEASARDWFASPDSIAGS